LKKNNWAKSTAGCVEQPKFWNWC